MRQAGRHRSASYSSTRRELPHLSGSGPEGRPAQPGGLLPRRVGGRVRVGSRERGQSIVTLRPHSSWSRRRNSALAATPPETTSVLGGVSPASLASSAQSFMAYLMRCSRCEIAACWKELATPARKARVSRTCAGRQAGGWIVHRDHGSWIMDHGHGHGHGHGHMHVHVHVHVQEHVHVHVHVAWACARACVSRAPLRVRAGLRAAPPS